MLLLGLAFVLQAKEAVEKALPLIEKSARVSMAERSCFTCHNHGMPSLALGVARARGFKTGPDLPKALHEHTESALRRNRES